MADKNKKRSSRPPKSLAGAFCDARLDQACSLCVSRDAPAGRRPSVAAWRERASEGEKESNKKTRSFSIDE